MKIFSGLREDIRTLMDEMGHEPESSLERESICPDTDIFLLTHDNIKALKLLLSQVLHINHVILKSSFENVGGVEQNKF